jgi:replicative DNA helicase
MYDKNIKVDMSTVFQKICDDKQQDTISAYDLTKLTDNITSTHHLNTHVELVIELYKRRKLVELGQRIKTEAVDGLDSE